MALGVAGILLQSLARNALASPDTLGVTAGAYLAVTALAA
ncbi:iron chelate uptake ABC transporter family permease subunit, partial [Microbacterium sp. NRRL B-14842]